MVVIILTWPSNYQKHLKHHEKGTKCSSTIWKLNNHLQHGLPPYLKNKISPINNIHNNCWFCYEVIRFMRASVKSPKEILKTFRRPWFYDFSNPTFSIKIPITGYQHHFWNYHNHMNSILSYSFVHFRQSFRKKLLRQI